MRRILLVCPDTGVSDELTLFLEHSGFQVAGVAESTQVMSEMDRCSPDIMVIRENGRRLNDDELCIRIRESSDVPILVLGQTEGHLAAVEMLEVGADAYLAYPSGTPGNCWPGFVRSCAAAEDMSDTIAILPQYANETCGENAVEHH